MSALDDELTEVLLGVRKGYDIFPFMGNVFPVAGARLTIIPDELLEFLKGQPEFRELEPGEKPRLMQFAGDYGATAGMMLYRSLCESHYYIVAPEF